MTEQLATFSLMIMEQSFLIRKKRDFHFSSFRCLYLSGPGHRVKNTSPPSQAWSESHSFWGRTGMWSTRKKPDILTLPAHQRQFNSDSRKRQRARTPQLLSTAALHGSLIIVTKEVSFPSLQILCDSSSFRWHFCGEEPLLIFTTGLLVSTSSLYIDRLH